MRYPIPPHAIIVRLELTLEKERLHAECAEKALIHLHKPLKRALNVMKAHIRMRQAQHHKIHAQTAPQEHIIHSLGKKVHQRVCHALMEHIALHQDRDFALSVLREITVMQQELLLMQGVKSVLQALMFRWDYLHASIVLLDIILMPDQRRVLNVPWECMDLRKLHPIVLRVRQERIIQPKEPLY